MKTAPRGSELLFQVSFLGLKLAAERSALWGSALLWLVLSMVAAYLLQMPLGVALPGGLLGVVTHWGAAHIHQSGHAWAARRTGYPMRGVRFRGLLAASLYPREEGSLPAAIHIRRAIGGPLISASAAILLGALAILLRPVGGLLWWLTLFASLDNFLVFSIGALLPLGFTDGSTILTWRGQS